MTGLPDFTKIDLAGGARASGNGSGGRFGCLRGARRHRHQACLHRGRHGQPRLPRYLPRRAALPARPLPRHVRAAAVDRAPVRRLLDGGRFQRLLPAQYRRRAEGPVGRLRPRHPPRLRQRPPARARRRRHGGRRHRFHLRHAHAVLRHPAGADVGVDDHERRRAARARPLHRRRRGAGRAAGEARRHHPERHPQRVHGAEHLHLSARALDAHRVRHLRLHLAPHAEVQLDIDLRLSHAGGRCDRRPRARLHAGRRHRVRARRRRRRARHRRLRAAPVVLLGDRHELLHGDRQDARRAPLVGEAPGGGVQAQGRPLAQPAHALPDVGLVADGAGRVQQRDAHVHRSHGGDAGAHAVAAYQCARRGHRPADRLLRPHRPQHAAPAAAGDRHLPRHRPVGRQLLHRAADLRARQQGARPHQGGRAARRHGQGDRRRHPQDAHRGSRRAHAGAHRQRQADHRRRQQVPRRRRGDDRHPQGRQQERARAADRQAGAAARPSATRRRRRRRSTP